MPIYPDKKGGKLTGRFRVEVQRGKLRYRKRFDTYEEALKKEAWAKTCPIEHLIGPVREDNRGRPKTVQALVSRLVDAFYPDDGGWGTICRSRLSIMLPWIGATELSLLTTEHLDTVVSKLKDRSMSPATINRYLSPLSKLLRAAEERKWLQGVPPIPWQDEDEGRIRWLTEEEEEALLANFENPRHRDFTVFLIETGLRWQSEGLVLTNVKDGWLHLSRTKNGKPRSVPLTPRAQAAWDRSGPFADIKEHEYRRAFNKAREAIGLVNDPDFVIHALRHTCATRLVMHEVDCFVIQKWMGHNTIQTTLRYAHVRPESLLRAAQKLASKCHQEFVLMTASSDATEWGTSGRLVSEERGGVPVRPENGLTEASYEPGHTLPAY